MNLQLTKRIFLALHIILLLHVFFQALAIFKLYITKIMRLLLYLTTASSTAAKAQTQPRARGEGVDTGCALCVWL